jgi:uncharacterized membrane protein YjgN (DUF898 family)
MTASTNSAFRFEGRWQEYAPIALTNLLLIVVTLGIYRFWATTRTRRYLWSRTQFIDEPLEWTGHGKELFIGFLFALALFIIPFVLLQFAAQTLALNGHVGLAGTITTAAGLGIFVLIGIARFRALRFRLSRTYWHGIRGGSEDNGIGYGFNWAFKTIIGYIPLWLLVPWAMISLWNERWEAMSFGTQRFRANARTGPVFRRFLLFYLAPVLIVVLIVAAAMTFGNRIGTMMPAPGTQPGPMVALGILAFVIAIYALLGLIAVVYYAAFLREAIGHLSLGEIDFHFTARTWQFLKLFLGDVLLVAGTLGIGIMFIAYRHWKFFITHLEATGEVSLSALGQSAIPQPKQGEGLLDALDIGAF